MNTIFSPIKAKQQFLAFKRLAKLKNRNLNEFYRFYKASSANFYANVFEVGL